MLDRPNQVISRGSSREFDFEAEHNVFSNTLYTPATVPALIIFYDDVPADEMVTEIRSFITLGPNVAGHEGICHGGLVMTLLDEVSGEIGSVNLLRGVIPPTMLVTAYLNTKFLRPVPAPSTVFSRTWLTKAEGRKYFVEVVIEDENGVALASADALFVAVREKL